jgi:hypothetical protein
MTTMITSVPDPLIFSFDSLVSDLRARNSVNPTSAFSSLSTCPCTCTSVSCLAGHYVVSTYSKFRVPYETTMVSVPVPGAAMTYFVQVGQYYPFDHCEQLRPTLGQKSPGWVRTRARLRTNTSVSSPGTYSSKPSPARPLLED